MSFSERLAEAWKAAGFKDRAAFARALAVQYHQVHGWETKGKVPDRANLEKISQATGRSIDWLLYGDRERSSSGSVPAEMLDRVVLDLSLDDGTAAALRAVDWPEGIPSEATLRSYAIDLMRGRAAARKSA